jgi:RHS repeat-associated protein
MEREALTYYLYNGHGDVIHTVDEAGTIKNQYAYDAFGNATFTLEVEANAIRYSGEYYDANTGLYYLRARYYNPYIGRFISEDSYWGEDDNPLSLNLYTYCHNDPVNYVDPSGHFAIGALVAGGLAAGAMKLTSGISRTISSNSGTKTSTSGGSSGTRRSSSSSSNSSNKNTSSSSNTSSTSNKTSNLAEVYESYIEAGSNRTSSNNGSVLLSIGSAVNNMYQSVNNTLSSVVNRVSTNSSIGNYNTSAQRIIKPFQLLGSSNILENIGELYLKINHRVIQDYKVVDGTILAPLTEVIGGLGGTVKPTDNGYVVNVNGQVINYDLNQITDGIGLASDYSAFHIYDQTIYVGVAETANKLGANIRYERRDGKISGLIVTPKDRTRWVDNEAIVVVASKISLDGLNLLAEMEVGTNSEYMIKENGEIKGIVTHDVGDGGLTVGYGYYIKGGVNNTEEINRLKNEYGIAVEEGVMVDIDKVSKLYYDSIITYENRAKNYINARGLKPSQHEFDALVIQAYNGNHYDVMDAFADKSLNDTQALEKALEKYRTFELWNDYENGWTNRLRNVINLYRHEDYTKLY